jgi:3-isopropylmalate/(R)-2-methylmalate dehydratase large subunit
LLERTPCTLIEKILSNASGKRFAEPGQLIVCQIEYMLFQSKRRLLRAMSLLDQEGFAVHDSSRFLVASERLSPVLMPGAFGAGDAHASIAGAFGSYLIDLDGCAVVGAMSSLTTWVRVPECCLVQCTGCLEAGTAPIDIVLALAHMRDWYDEHLAIEYGGPAIQRMNMEERIELIQCSRLLNTYGTLIAPDEATLEVCRTVNPSIDERAIAHWRSDPQAPFSMRYDLPSKAVVPRIALGKALTPVAVTEMRGAPASRVMLGSPDGGASLADLRRAAAMLRGKKIASSVDFVTYMPSDTLLEQTKSEGTLQPLLDAGMRLIYASNSGAAQQRTLATSTVISADRRCYASAFTCVASAIAGSIVEPREYMPAVH